MGDKRAAEASREGATEGPGAVGAPGEQAAPRRKARRPGGRSAQVRAAVLAATVEGLLDTGLDGLSIGEIARRSGVHESSIYRRWKTKANVAVDAVVSRTNIALPDPDAGSLRGDLVALLLNIAEFVATPLGRLLVELASRQDMPEYQAAREKFRTERLTAGMAVLQRAEERGELRPGVNHRLAFETLIGPLHVRLLLTRDALTREFVEDVVDLVLTGIAAEPARRPRH
ncbi:TetR/AcrR family transcriptional regulator [Streptomyces sp. ODS28]|uniref:TetR/AcrR family transcriptional regulator n=1 Tax=Streptomyces sp. ODS28 TaxID=3136688 RepID=UPI0031E60F94